MRGPAERPAAIMFDVASITVNRLAERALYDADESAPASLVEGVPRSVLRGCRAIVAASRPFALGPARASLVEHRYDAWWHCFEEHTPSSVTSTCSGDSTESAMARTRRVPRAQG